MNTSLDAAEAWQRYKPSSSNRWDLKKVGHLYRRAGFGANWTDLQKGLALGPDKLIDALLKGGEGQEAFDKQMAEMAGQVAAANNEQQMRALWLFRIVYSPHPLREKLTLFWHNHFATSNAKLNNVAYMQGQNDLLRKHALGKFGPMLQEMSKDPAMMIWLDTNLSTKGMPNENYARELMELFSLGIGNYSEQDIREAARAFTGWEIKDGKYFFNKGQFDGTEKTFLSRKGKFRGEDIVQICLEQEACPYFISRKLFTFFVSETAPPTKELLKPLAERLRKTDFDIADLVSTMLRSNLFFSEHAYRTRIKSPTDFGIGIVKALEGRVGTTGLAQAMENLGQKLFYPPSVKGWDGGTTWLNSTTLLQRHNLAQALTSTEDNRFGRRLDPAELVRKHGKSSDADTVGFFVELFLQGDLPTASRSSLMQYMQKSKTAPYPVYWSKEDVQEHRVRALCHLVLTQPEFQLD
jgi:uncharacterized protein (DUF1800 family)